LFRAQFDFLRRQFLQEGELAGTNVLSREAVAQALDSIEVAWNERIYTPLVTLWVFLGQVISADHSCRAAVASLVVRRISNGDSPCSSQTGAYCRARKRSPEAFFAKLARGTGAALDGNADSGACSQRNLGARDCLQPDPHHHGSILSPSLHASQGDQI
jgi:hypothetical protein